MICWLILESSIFGNHQPVFPNFVCQGYVAVNMSCCSCVISHSTLLLLWPLNSFSTHVDTFCTALVLYSLCANVNKVYSTTSKGKYFTSEVAVSYCTFLVIQPKWSSLTVKNCIMICVSFKRKAKGSTASVVPLQTRALQRAAWSYSMVARSVSVLANF